MKDFDIESVYQAGYSDGANSTNVEYKAIKKKIEMSELMKQFFAFKHLPEHLQKHSKPFSDLADHIIETLPRNPERSAALRKLLEAKDCAVRAKIYKTE